MRKSFTVLLLFSLCFSITQSVLAQSRPRRVAQPVNVPSREDNSRPDETAPTVQPRRPVLTGNVSTGNSDAKSQPTPEADGPVDIGEGETVRVETTLVTIPVSVTDRDGRYIPNLSKEDFRIFENGVEQQVAYFAPVEKPFTVALVIDTSNSTRFKIEEIQDAAIAFVNQLRPDDRVMVVAFAEHVRVLSEPTSDPAREARGCGHPVCAMSITDRVLDQHGWPSRLRKKRGPFIPYALHRVHYVMCIAQGSHHQSRSLRKCILMHRTHLEQCLVVIANKGFAFSG